jgi:hypothetical protein
MDSVFQTMASGYYYMTVADEEYTLWTNDSNTLFSYMAKYPDTKFVTCMDNSKKYKSTP